ncbi:TraB/GumN family protein [Pseudidiomarina taiwanensis]|nr:TraB/GumN family protein [Pseudidiomarina taiwanensis]
MRTKWIFITAIAAVVGLHGIVAQASLLYKVEHPTEPTRQAYLFGTVHMICTEQVKFGPRLENALTAADSLVLELNPLADDFAAQLAKYSNYDQPYLNRYLEPAKVRKLTAHIKRVTGLDYPQYATLKPFALSSLLMQTGLPCEQGQTSYEEVLLERATVLQHPVMALETIAQQAQLFDSIPLEEQAISLYESIHADAQMIVELTVLLDIYLSEDIEALYQVVIESDEMQNYHQLFLDQRNQRWITQLPDLWAKSQRPFIAVGAAHLGGPQGLLKLLQQAGYKVTPLSEKAHASASDR